MHEQVHAGKEHHQKTAAMAKEEASGARMHELLLQACCS
jgi:hypothetical protein